MGRPEGLSSYEGIRLSPMSTVETRRLVTVLFCDMTGSTELGTRLDAESVRDLTTRFYERMRDVAARHGGTVEKFVGDAMLVVFGIPNVHEDDALRAVRAAFEMRSTLSELNVELRRDYAVEIRTRTGLGSGEVVAGADRGGAAYVTGNCVNLAARLQQHAEPDEILLSDETRGLVRDAVLTEPVTMSLKSYGSDVGAHRLIGLVPGAAGHARRSDSRLVGRDAEMTLLSQMFARAAADHRCHLITVLGSAGVGKTRLVQECVARIGERARVLRGTCLPYGDGVTFHPLAEAVEAAAGIDPSDGAARVVEKIGEALPQDSDRERVSRLLARAIGVSESLRPQGLDDTMWAVRTFFGSLARRLPLVLVFEDIHWGEVTFLDLIEHVAGAWGDVPVLIACTARPELLEHRDTWGGGQRNATTIHLEPLGTDESDRLIHQLLGERALDEQVRSRIARTAGGNPLFAEEIVSALLEDGTLVAERDRWVPTRDTSGMELPPTLAGLIGSRLDRLDPAERRLLEAASVIGQEFPIVAAEALGDPASLERTDELVAGLERKDLLRPTSGDGYRFRHLLIRDVTYASLPKRSRATMHERYAEWLETAPGDGPEGSEEIVGYHLESAHGYLHDMGRRGEHVDELGWRAGRRLVAAGRKAAGIGDMPATTNLLTRAERLLPPSDQEMLHALPDLADSLYQAGEAGRGDAVLVRMLERATGAGDRALTALAQLERSSWELVIHPESVNPVRFREVTEGAIAALEQLGAVEQLPSAFESLALLHRLFTGDITAMLEASARGLEAARRTENPQAVAATLLQFGRALVLGPLPCDEALDRLETIGSSFTGDRMLEAVVSLDAATLLGMLGRSEQATPRAERARTTFEELGQRRWMAEASAVAGEIAGLAGDARLAESSHRLALEVFREGGESLDVSLAICALGLALCDLGREPDAGVLLESVGDIAQATGLEPQAGLRRVDARVRATRGELIEGIGCLETALTLLEPTQLVAVRGELHLEMASLLRSAGSESEARSSAEGALSLFEGKRFAAAAERARGSLRGAP
jgi:class 3 adenylate cyclase/tetratricopeptide (TPR) repeat protein